MQEIFGYYSMVLPPTQVVKSQIMTYCKTKLHINKQANYVLIIWRDMTKVGILRLGSTCKLKSRLGICQSPIFVREKLYNLSLKLDINFYALRENSKLNCVLQA